MGLNPKLNNLMPGYSAAQYELIMISDSGIMGKLDLKFCMVEIRYGKVWGNTM